MDAPKVRAARLLRRMHEDVLRPWVEVRPERHAPIRECRRDGAPLLLLLHFVLILTFHPEPPWQCSVARGEGGPRRGEPVGARGAEDKSAQRERHELERAREQHEARRCELQESRGSKSADREIRKAAGTPGGICSPRDAP
eukprot:scaffold98949_cov32-Tisochrysis_lutea.AAC.6